MAAQIQPVIATRAQVATYLGMSVAQLASTIGDGITTLGGYIDFCLLDTAWRIVNWCNFDYTTSQRVWETWQGDDLPYHELSHTMVYAAGDSFYRYPVRGNAITDAVTLNASNDITTDGGPSDTYKIWVNPLGTNKLTSFSAAYIYGLTYTTGNTAAYLPYIIGSPTGWPLELVQIQIEMVALRIKESAIGWGGGATSASGAIAAIGLEASYPQNSIRHAVKFKDMYTVWAQRARAYRKQTI